MQTIRSFAQPAVLVLLWIVLAATTAAELTTVGPSLRAAAVATTERAVVRTAAARARQWHVRHADACDR
jgi:hypothetical protein